MKYLTVILLLLSSIAWADNNGDRITQSNDNNNMTTGDVTVDAGSAVITGDSRAYAFAHGLGDVDINQCLASTQWGTILVSKQKVVLNKWCAAEVYDAKGLYEMAARVRCDIEEIAKFFPNDNAGCVLANTIIPEPVPVPALAEEHFDEEQAWHDEQLELLADLEAKIANLEEEQERETRQVQAVQRQVQQTNVNSSGISEEQRMAIAEVLKKGEEK